MSTVAQNTTELPPLDAPPQAKDQDIVMAEEGEEDEEHFVESFASVSELRAHGIQAADIVKLTKAGLTTVGLVASASTRELAAIKARARRLALAIRSTLAFSRARVAGLQHGPRRLHPRQGARRGPDVGLLLLPLGPRAQAGSRGDAQGAESASPKRAYRARK